MSVLHRAAALAVTVVCGVGAIQALSSRGVARAEPGSTQMVGGALYRVDAEQAARAGVKTIPASVRRAGATFGAGVTAADRDLIFAAVAAARPEAQALIDLVDGLVTIEVGEPQAGAAGTTTLRHGRFEILLALGPVASRMGHRGVERLVLHELGHVIDFALLPDTLVARLDRGIPTGYGCDGGLLGGCAAMSERFAETFAKWATGDIGVGIDLGYKVPPPDVLDTWGEPLAGVGRAAGG